MSLPSVVMMLSGWNCTPYVIRTFTDVDSKWTTITIVCFCFLLISIKIKVGKERNSSI